MVFLSICTALYDYVPQGDGELPIHEGELVYILEKSTEDEWWKAKKKAPGEGGEEPMGLIPKNYVEEVSHFRHHMRRQKKVTENIMAFLAIRVQSSRPGGHFVASLTDRCSNCRSNPFIVQRRSMTIRGRLMRNYLSLKMRRS
jgi:hypothetical protein